IYVTDSLPGTDPQKSVIEKFVKDYQAKFGGVPSTFAGNGYDATMMVIEAIRQAGGTDHQKIRDAIEGLKDHVGVTAVYSYSPTDHFGARAGSVVMLTIKDGKFVLTK
ncbi:MAG: ABC transporter substrate-binding protein, partial [Roseiarcus sp.]